MKLWKPGTWDVYNNTLAQTLFNGMPSPLQILYGIKKIHIKQITISSPLELVLIHQSLINLTNICTHACMCSTHVSLIRLRSINSCFTDDLNNKITTKRTQQQQFNMHTFLTSISLCLQDMCKRNCIIGSKYPLHLGARKTYDRLCVVIAWRNVHNSR